MKEVMREGKQEDSVNFTDNYVIVLWKKLGINPQACGKQCFYLLFPTFPLLSARSSPEVQRRL